MSRKAARVIQRGGNRYSHVTLWELAIKSALGKIQLTANAERVTARSFVLIVASRLQLTPIAIEFDDLAGVESLPSHHNDPFDRLLAVQARRRGLSIVSSDPMFERYGIERVW